MSVYEDFLKLTYILEILYAQFDSSDQILVEAPLQVVYLQSVSYSAIKLTEKCY